MCMPARMCTPCAPQLAVDLALAFDGEVVSADSMQLYSGLPIVTNAVTEHEMQGVPHHLVGCVPPSTATTVHHFVALALPVIDGIRARGKLVVVVGGTNVACEQNECKQINLAPTHSEKRLSVSYHLLIYHQ